MPSRQTVHQWRMKIAGFADAYARAREIGMESMADDVLTISDDDAGDVNPDGTPNHVNVQRARLMVDSRKFLMAKLAPSVYGDRVEVEHSGAVAHVHTLPDRERMRRLATFMLEDRDAGLTIEGQAEQAGSTAPGVTLPSPAPASPASDRPAAEDEPRARTDEV